MRLAYPSPLTVQRFFLRRGKLVDSQGHAIRAASGIDKLYHFLNALFAFARGTWPQPADHVNSHPATHDTILVESTVD